MLKSYINPEENQEAKRLLPKLMVEGLLLGGSGLGVLALIFEIADGVSLNFSLIPSGEYYFERRTTPAFRFSFGYTRSA